MKKFVPTTGMVKAAEAVFMAKALVETIRPLVLAYQTAILAEGQWHIRPDFATRLGAEVILDPKLSYLMSDEDFAEYCAKCKIARDKAKLHVDADDKSPLLVAEHLVMQAQHALIDAMSDVTKIEKDRLLSVGMKEYKQYIDLTLSLLAPFVKNNLAAA